ncbi:polysaccharide pyruvyl transferase family protein [Rheinheimera sp.]|uniref:polysaccharide pyruvyl transferase family protein n=1 Tax=Rheinheimera sp. TaxID=1869214 RepID=UPI00307D6EDD
MTFIEIRGVQFVNKGAELMLHAVLQQLQQCWPQAQVVLQTGANSPYQARAVLGAYQKAGLRLFGIEMNAYSDYLPKKLRQWLIRQFGIVTEADIDVVLDASGFAYGDQWPEAHGLHLADELKRFARRGKAYVFLPQAFGPFSREKERRALTEALPLARLVLARDPQSLQHVRALCPQGKVQQAPDFTNLVQGALLACTLPANTLTMIPNYQMLSPRNADRRWRDSYLPVLTHLMFRALEQGMQVLVLNHEGKKDQELCEALVAASQGRATLRQEADPLVVKALIGQSKAVICSRFHGCVSALSQGVPCLGTSWSHKYQALFADYKQQQFLLEPDFTDLQLTELLDELLVQNPETVLQASAGLKQQSEQMWNLVTHSLSEQRGLGAVNG